MQPQSGRPLGTVVQQQGFPDSTRTLNQNRLAVATSRRDQQRSKALEV
jgi:hypothetical protein